MAGLSVDAVAAEDLDPAAREAILTAIEDGPYETGTVPAALARAVADHDYVREGAAFYELDATFPRYRVTHERPPAEDVPGDADVIALESIDSEAAETILVDGITSGRIETPYLPPAFRRIYEEYEYVEWREQYHELTVERIDPGPPLRPAGRPGADATPRGQPGQLRVAGDRPERTLDLRLRHHRVRRTEATGARSRR